MSVKSHTSGQAVLFFDVIGRTRIFYWGDGDEIIVSGMPAIEYHELCCSFSNTQDLLLDGAPVVRSNFSAKLQILATPDSEEVSLEVSFCIPYHRGIHSE